MTKINLNPFENLGILEFNRKTYFDLFVLFFIAFVVHAFVLTFIFPGHYSPTIPHHSDHYLPTAIANSTENTLFSYLMWPRPIGMLFFSLIGNLGILGSTAAIVAVVLFNCALTAFIVAKVLNIKWTTKFLWAYFLYLFILFSHPHFYVFYSQDAFAQLSYFFLIIAFILYVEMRKNSLLWAGFYFFIFNLIAFLSKETYGPAALIITIWLGVYSYGNIWRRFHLIFLSTAALIISLLYSRYLKSVFVSGDTAGISDPYYINLSPISIVWEWFRYAKEGLHLVFFALIFAIILLSIFRKNSEDIRIIKLSVICCILAGLVSWLPNAILPNHHFSGYSWSGSYILYIPILLFSLESISKNYFIFFFALIFGLSASSKYVSKSEYEKASWVLTQELTQKNLLHAMQNLTNGAESSCHGNVLVTGLSFPFSPFDHPKALSVYPGIEMNNIDVVRYKEFKSSERKDGVRFISPDQVQINNYNKFWMFTSDGKLFRSQCNQKNELERSTVLGFSAKDMILFPDIAKVFNYYEYDSFRINNDGYKQLKCGDIFSTLFHQDALALRCYEASIRSIPTNPFPYYSAGIILERNNKLKEALFLFEKAIENDNVSNPNSAFNDSKKRVLSAM